MSTIGIFDSGVGGLTVLQALRRRIPGADYLYLGDTARLARDSFYVSVGFGVLGGLLGKVRNVAHKSMVSDALAGTVGPNESGIVALVKAGDLEAAKAAMPTATKVRTAGVDQATAQQVVEAAKQAGRSSFGEMVDYLRQHPEARIILVEKTDRLYRNLKDWVTLDELDLEIHFVKENVVLSADSRSSEKFMHGIKVLMAKNYIDNLSEETRKGMTEKAEQGIWPSYAPLGYRNVTGPDGKKRIEPDPDRLRPSDIPKVVCDYGRLGACTGWQPAIAFEQSLLDVLNEWRGHMRVGKQE